ncbi:DUF6262 family protein [Solwaraspora sp. WMMD1047]|uniref:DUF6262 family protein n=1 Tax=Solwaraspora sp. WMMD1047 TaxID=3016102 RepID=UPI002417B3CE|nr:DUF6262 family protein [Solwaraspora sp. WMMD1047]MDG4834122.1 DUF6262 family protein [Solwaraspora sp. WMMD1047]
MTRTVSSQRIDAAIAARRRTTSSMLDRVRAVLHDMRRERSPVTVSAVQRRANVSRTFLYQNTDARRLIRETATEANAQRSQTQAAAAAATEAAWRERALNAEDGLKTAYQEIHDQRARIGELLGRIRDLELDLPEDAVQRLVTENTTLKQQIRTLTADAKNLNERLAAARENNRSQDKQIAELQAELLDQPQVTRHLRPL